MPFILKTPQDVQQELAERSRLARLNLNYTREGLASRAGISVGTVKRFEKTGHISIDSLLKIALVLNNLGEFENVFSAKNIAPASIDDLLRPVHTPKRGRLK